MTLLGYKSARSTMKVYAAPSMSDEEEQEEQANDIQKKKREEEEEPEHQHSYSYSDTREEKDDVQEEEEEIPAPMIVIEQKTNPSKDATVIPVGSISENVTVPSFHEASSQSQEVPPLLQLYVSKESPGTNLRTLRAMAHTLRMPLSLSKSKSNSSSNSTNERSSSSSSSPTKEPGNTPGVVKRSGSVTALLQRRNTLKRIKDFNNRAALIQQKDSVVPDGNSGNSSNSSNSGDNGNNNDNDDSGGGGIVEIPTNIKKELTLEEARRHFLILPTDFSFWICWNSIHLLVLCYLCTIVPYLTAFNHDSTNTSGSSSYTYLNRLIDFFYVLDIFVNFRSCYMDFETGEMIYDVKKIAFHYTRNGWFVFDLCMTFPLDLIMMASFENTSSGSLFLLKSLRLVRLTKLMRILKIQQLVDFCEDILHISRNHLVVLQLVTTIFIVAHITACGFILAGKLSTQQQHQEEEEEEFVEGIKSSWIIVNHLHEEEPSTIYIAALYWAFTMMTTVGFGDIVPITHVERIYSIFAMVLSAGVYAYVIASMSSIVSLMNLGQSRYYEKLNELNAYMESRQLPQALVLRTRRFYRYFLLKKTVFDEKQIFEGLPSHLREELIDFYIKKVIQHLCFFQDVEKNFTAQIALRLKPSFFPPFNVIIQIEEIGTEMFIISKGCVEVFLTINKQQQEEQERSVCMLFDGDFFGEMAFCMDPIHSLRMANVRSKTYCELHTLDYSSLQEAIERFPLVKKKLFTTAHTRHALLNNLQKTKVDLLFHKHHPHHHGKASSSSSSSPLKGHLHHGQL